MTSSALTNSQRQAPDGGSPPDALSPLRAVAFILLLALSGAGLNAMAAEALAPLRVDPSLLGGRAAAKSPTQPKPQSDASPFVPVVTKPAEASISAKPKPGGPGSEPTAAAEHFVQVGAFSVRANAEKRKQQLASELGPLSSKLLIRPKDKFFLILMGPWPDAATAQNMRKQLRRSHDLEATYVLIPAPDSPSGNTP